MPCNPPPAWMNGFMQFSFQNRINSAGRGVNGLTCTSWYRTPFENQAVGGHKFSQHQVGWAIDVTGPVDQQQLFGKRARLAGLNVVHESDHTHIQLVGAGVLESLFGR